MPMMVVPVRISPPRSTIFAASARVNFAGSPVSSVGAMDAAGDLYPRGSQRRVERDDGVAVKHLDQLAVRFQQPHMLDAFIERLLAAIEIEDATTVAVVVDLLVGNHLVQHAL